MDIKITNHARERFGERWADSEPVEQAAQHSFVDGSSLKRNLLKTMMLLGYGQEGYWTANYRVYKKMVFVYQKEYTNTGVTFILTTVMPLKWLFKRRAEMFQRFQKQEYAPHSRRTKKKNQRRWVFEKMLGVWRRYDRD